MKFKDLIHFILPTEKKIENKRQTFDINTLLLNYTLRVK